jgi:hypothetical protein
VELFLRKPNWQLVSRLLDSRKNVKRLQTIFSKILENTLRREIGLTVKISLRKIPHFKGKRD